MDILTEQSLLQTFRARGLDTPLFFYPEIDSTNTKALQLAREALAGSRKEIANAAVIVAETQSAGRGRSGRSFVSPMGGLYYSILLRDPSLLQSLFSRLTLIAAVAVCRAVERLSPLQPGIKWVNDLYLNGKKVCGILAQGLFSPQGQPQAAVLGIGVNLFPVGDGFDGPLRESAGTLFDSAEAAAFTRAELAAAITEELLRLTCPSQLRERASNLSQCDADLSQRKTDLSLLDEYRARCPMIGRTVTWHDPYLGTDLCSGTVTAINDEGALELLLSDGTRRVLRDGEVHLGYVAGFENR